MRRFRDAVTVILDTLKVVWELDNKIIPITAMRAFVDAATPFIGLIVSSKVIEGFESGQDPDVIVFTALLGVSLTFVLSLVSGWLEKLNSVHKTNCFLRYNTKVGEVTMDMDFPLLESPKSQELRDRMINDNSWGSGLYSVFYFLQQLMQSFFAMLFSVGVMLPMVTDSSLLLSGGAVYYFLFVVALTLITVYINEARIMKRFNRLLDKKTELIKGFWFYLSGSSFGYKSGKDIRLYNAQPLICKNIEMIVDANAECGQEASTFQGLNEGLNRLSSGLIQGSAYLYVGLNSLSGYIGLGEVVRYAGAIYQFSSALSGIVVRFGALHTSSVRQRSTLEYMNIGHVLRQGTLPVEKRYDYKYALEFRNVSFKYPGSDAWALKNLSLRLAVGKRLAVVGMNGSGKTTMIKLLCRLYDPTEGEITLNGIDIRKYDYQEYMRIFSVVFQDFKLFSFSLGRNVAADMEYEAGRAEACLSMAGLGERLKSMPKGLETAVYKDFEEDGVEISGGEAQKVALARALYKNAPFVVLDEPTAALDPIAEYDVYSRFNDIVGGRTAVFISHRLSSCRFCDDIAVFHEGGLVQRGSHDALLTDTGGIYYRLWNAQAQYYMEK